LVSRGGGLKKTLGGKTLHLLSSTSGQGDPQGRPAGREEEIKAFHLNREEGIEGEIATGKRGKRGGRSLIPAAEDLEVGGGTGWAVPTE